MNYSNKDWDKPLPKKGDKIVYRTPTKFSFFKCVIEDENKFLKLEETYTVKEIIQTSSATYVELEEFPYYDKDRKLPFFSLWAFEW